MGLPRYLDDKFKRMTDKEKIELLYNLSTGNFGFGEELPEDGNVILYLKYNYSQKTNDILKFAFKIRERFNIVFYSGFIIRDNQYEYSSSFDKVQAKYYYRLEKNNKGVWVYCYKNVTTNRYFKEILELKTYLKFKKEYDIIQKREEILKLKTIEQGRNFTGKLRQAILERDNYKCVLCGRSAKDGVKLEIDHIVPWIDGGKTMYNNGQVLCSDCNKGKHHIKKYNRTLEELKTLSESSNVYGNN